MTVTQNSVFFYLSCSAETVRKGILFMTTKTLLITYVLVMNLIAFFTMGIDKRKAVKHAYRIPEATLFTLSAMGGSIGSLLGMYYFHHKTRKIYFRIGMPAILIIHILLLLAFRFYFSDISFLS